MRISCGIDGLDGLMQRIEDDLEADVTASMREGVPALRDELGDQVRRAGLSPILARAWKAIVYPESGDSLDPAGIVYSKAPAIIAGFTTGATIRPIDGSRFLAIPTKDVPRGRGRGRKSRMTPGDVEHYFNQDLILRPGRHGTLLGFVDVIAGRSARRPGYRQRTAGRLAQGRQSKLVLMFVFVPEIRVPKLLNLDDAATRAAAMVGRLLVARRARRRGE